MSRVLIDIAQSKDLNMRRSYLLFGSDNRPTDAFVTLLSAVGIPGIDLININEELQKRFFQVDPITKLPRERWELKEVEVNCPATHIKEHLAKCGFVNATEPTKKTYDWFAWPGALVTRAAGRLNDLASAWKNGVTPAKTIAFGGKRLLMPDKESYDQCCKAVCPSQIESDIKKNIAKESWDILKPETELHMMQWLWNLYSGTPHQYGCTFIDAPMKPPSKPGGQPVRPNTEDTVMEWLKSNPKPGSILLSSGAPYGMAMDEAFNMLLAPHGFTIETFGHAAPENLGIEVLMREVAGAVNRIKRARIG